MSLIFRRVIVRHRGLSIRYRLLNPVHKSRGFTQWRCPSVCLSVCLSVCRLWKLRSHSLRGISWWRAGAYCIDSDTLVTIFLVLKSSLQCCNWTS